MGLGHSMKTRTRLITIKGRIRSQILLIWSFDVLNDKLRAIQALHYMYVRLSVICLHHLFMQYELVIVLFPCEEAKLLLLFPMINKKN